MKTNICQNTARPESEFLFSADYKPCSQIAREYAASRGEEFLHPMTLNLWLTALWFLLMAGVMLWGYFHKDWT